MAAGVKLAGGRESQSKFVTGSDLIVDGGISAK